MFMMFSTGIAADDDGYTMDDMYVIHDGKLWIPVETTVVGSSFVKAWELVPPIITNGKTRGSHCSTYILPGIHLSRLPCQMFRRKGWR